MSLEWHDALHPLRAMMTGLVRSPHRWPVSRRLLVAVGASVLAGAGRPAAALAQSARPALAQYLRSVGIDDKQRADAARGRAVAKLLPTKDSRDVTVLGVIGVNVPRDTVVTRALDVGSFLAARGRRFHVFAHPPSPADVRDVMFDESEYRGLRNCRKGDCDFKLSASAMTDFVERVDWSARDAKAQADERLRAEMLRLVTEYASRGNAGMPTYDDGMGVQSAASFDALVAQTSDLYAVAPELQRYLSTYPAQRPDGARDVLYWAEERLPRLRPTLTLNHLVVYAAPGRGTGAAFVARKQIYASHYFEAALELLAIVDGDGATGEPRTYLLTMRRFRFDALPGGLFNIRGRVRRQLVDATRADLERQRAAVQQTATP